MNHFLTRCINVSWNLATLLKRSLYRYGIFSVKKLPAPCISIGNIAVGGTGKSPLVELIAQLLLDEGHSPAVLTRGYRSGVGKSGVAVFQYGRLVLQKKITTPIYPDEARMLSAKLGPVPIVVSPDRFEAASWYLTSSKQKVTHWILDDGFQHVQIHRDLDIVLLDAHSFRPQNQIFRESFWALQRADLVIWTRCDEHAPNELEEKKIKLYTHQIPMKSFFHMKPPCLPLDQKEALLLSSKVFVFCGIANPSWFLSGLDKMGIFIQETYIVSDHQLVTQADLKNRIGGAEAVVTTEKDYYRDPAIFENFPIPVYIVPLYVDVDRKLLVSSLIRTAPL